MLPVRVPFEKSEYDASCVQYEEATDRKLRNTDTIILGGYGVQMKVQHKALVMCYDRVNSEEKTVTLYRGTNKVRQVIICSDGGYITIDAIKWCVDENITIYLLDWRGSLVQVLAPKQPSHPKLVYQQYTASQCDLCIDIARELISRKATSQIAVLKNVPDHPIIKGRVLLWGGRRAVLRIEVEYGDLIWKQFEDGIEKLARLKDIEAIRLLEAQLAFSYWSVLVGIPINWKVSDWKKVPPHWHQVTERISNISSYHNAQRATNPFHSALNFAYALLEGQVLRSIIAAGLEPTCGYLHTCQEGCVNILAYDLMEPFRAVVDAKVLAFFEKTTFKKGDFIQTFSGEVRLNEELRRYILASCRVQNTDIDELVHWLKATLEKT